MDGIKRTGNGRGGARVAVEQVDIGSVEKQKVVTDDSVLNLAQKRGKGSSPPAPEPGVPQKVPGPEDLSASLKGHVMKRGVGGLDATLLGAGGDAPGVGSDTEDHRDKRRKTIRKHFTDVEQQAYDAMYSDLLRKHVKLCSFDEIQASIAAVVPERFSMEQKSALASSTYSNLAVQYSRIRKSQIKMLQSDTAATRWLDELNQNQMMDPLVKQKEIEDRLLDAAKYLAARTISKTSPYYRPTDEELERARKLLKKWMNPAKRNELLMSLVKPKRGADLSSSK